MDPDKDVDGPPPDPDVKMHVYSPGDDSQDTINGLGENASLGGNVEPRMIPSVPISDVKKIVKEPSLDLLERIPGMYRLLDLLNDEGSGGIVDKVVIDQESVARFANDIHPGSYRSTTQVDFHALDERRIKPLGVYGSIPAIAAFLVKLNVINQETCDLLIALRNGKSGGSVPALKPGIYLLDLTRVKPDMYHIIFWPEDATWQDDSISSVSRNRVTFMRYMTKLCDQLVCLISNEHSANLVWKDEPQYMEEDPDEERESFEAYDRLFAFSVQQTNEEEETAVAKPGFKLQHRSIRPPPIVPSGFPANESPDILTSQLIVGQTSQAILQVDFIPRKPKEVKIDQPLWSIALTEKLSEKLSPSIELSDTLDTPSLRILLQHGLWRRCDPDLESQWSAQVKADGAKREEDKKGERKQLLGDIAKDVAMLQKAMPLYLVDTATKLYPSLVVSKSELLVSMIGPEANSMQETDSSLAVAQVTSWLEQNSALAEARKQEIRADLQVLASEEDKKDPYITLKRRLRRVHFTIEQTPGLSDEEVQHLIDLINLDEGFTAALHKILDAKRGQSQGPNLGGGFIQKFQDAFTDTISKVTQVAAKRKLPTLEPMDDVFFAGFLESLTSADLAYKNAMQEIKKEMIERLGQKLKNLCKLPHDIGRALQEAMDAELNRRFDSRTKEESETSWKTLKSRISDALLSKRRQTGSLTIIESVVRDTRGYNYGSDSFRLRGASSTIEEASLQYTLQPLQVREDDVKRSADDRSFVCEPIIRPNSAYVLTLPFDVSIRFIRLVGKDSCLIVLRTKNHLEVYLDYLNSLRSALDRKSSKKTIHLEKIGSECLFALDEVKRLLAIISCHDGSIIVYVYIYDKEGKAFNARGAAINITRWYHGAVLPTFTQMVFVPGTEELLLIDSTGSCRIFSLMTETFRPSTLDLGESIHTAFSSPDATCLFLVTGVEETRRILCFHWASFGSNNGIEISRPDNIPAHSPMVVSSIGHSSIPHILFLVPEDATCYSVHIQITSKSSDFNVHSDANGFGTSGQPKSSINNSLMDCHADVWTRFPVYGGAIKRETSKAAIHQTRSILFVSSVSPAGFSQYFAMLIRDFEGKTRKPTRGMLRQIKITSSPDLPLELLRGDITTSELPLGEWLVGCFCLIPIHLAVTNSNRFNPLKDGMSSPEFERGLLGANVTQISQALSFGWYESIFTSYYAKKPVKVVTSMGEQSVGKSFALNHFVDTSFAGSAMRCTEGVWLSVTPTRDYIVVAMDFEAVHSIERSAQEDTLMVLLNAAISNFILFRNNFAVSRDIAGLFKGFQSSTNVLDTAVNTTLFNGTLGIIIKDVIDSDTKEIVSEFRQKFQQIVQQEKADNFISKLHKGKFDIIPWPVIESTRFYELFGALKMRLDRQPLTHRHAGAFIVDLKMLMAKLKANDWGALDLNLAVQRAEQLSASLAFALAFGTTDPSIGEPLKNFDTGDGIPGPAQTAIFHLESAAKAIGNDLSVHSYLASLRGSFPEYFDHRFKMQEDEFFSRLTAYLRLLVTSRIEHVDQWLKVNTERFNGKAEVINLFRDFESLAKELRAGVALCGSKCSSCGLLCLEHKLHEGNHECKTSHKCPQLCSFDQHTTDFPPCGIPAGHSGRHVCSGTPHLCDEPCQLKSKDGCLISCSKPMDHDEDDDHLCAANVHACGEPCSLVKPDGTRICKRSCIVDCRREHIQHTCDRSLSCPLKCQLCSSFCAVRDHFHALESGAIHLCGQEHPCRRLCQQPGICEIATTPQSIESTFVGKHETHLYTKYTQEAKRLHCIIPIAPDQLEHTGPHRHSLDSTAFHHCEERCKQCGYYCTLPLNHPQNQHETSHGSMSQTQWVVEGDEHAAVELQGHKYATGDSGAPMLCSMICKTLGRHVHIENCRLDEDRKCVGGVGIEHAQSRDGITSNKDWITHRLFWARSGFRDPYTNTEQADFDLCENYCGGEEHNPDINPGAPTSHCTLPLFHPAADATNAPPLGHTSIDGHAYQCKNPAQMQRSFHIFFAIDRSGSMTGTDRRPLPNSPATQRIVQRADNRFGAVVSSLYGFWTAREAATRSGIANGMRRDAYTIIPFDSTASTILSNDMTSNPDRLLQIVLRHRGGQGGTNFTHALQIIQSEMGRTWVTERSPVVVFLSDGECRVADDVVYDLCRRAVTLGKPLSLHTVSFGSDTYSHSLRRMAAIAGEVYTSAPRDPLAPGGNPCTFSAALDTVQLAETFMSIATSLKNPRAALSRV